MLEASDEQLEGCLNLRMPDDVNKGRKTIKSQSQIKKYSSCDIFHIYYDRYSNEKSNAHITLKAMLNVNTITYT